MNWDIKKKKKKKNYKKQVWKIEEEHKKVFE